MGGLYKVHVYTLFLVSSVLWACLVFFTGVRDVQLSPDQTINCDVIRVLNQTVETLNKHEQRLNKAETTQPTSRTVYPSAIDVVFNNFTLKEQLRSRIKHIINSHVRPADKSYNFNVTASDYIAIDRGITDPRPQQCQRIKYDINSLQTTSVVIPFYNEALSMLFRTAYSILKNTPDVLLREVILVDDSSTYPYLEKLPDYISLLPKVRVMRNDQRQGLVRSRLIGAEMSRGEVVVFLDAHTEANIGWLEPILAYLSEHSNAVIQPFVDGIGQWDIEYSKPDDILKGATSWDLRYVWIEMAEHEQEQVRIGNPFFTPTLIGCAIAVNKQYFNMIGGFDAQQLIWGGENIELSFRAWLCGGRVVTLPCSRVGHLFREIPYRAGDPKWLLNLHSNQMRVAEVWLGEYKPLFYASTTVYPARNFNLSDSQWASLKERHQLRESLHCKPFSWYMENVVPNIPIPPHDALYHGELMNQRTRACWDVLPDGYVKVNYLCFEHRILVSNFFTLNLDGFLLFRDKCVKIELPGPALRVEKCPPRDDIMNFGHWKMRYHGDPQWGQIQVERKINGEIRKWCIHQVTSVTAHSGMQMPQVGPCDKEDPFQKWSFTYRFDKIHGLPAP